MAPDDSLEPPRLIQALAARGMIDAAQVAACADRPAAWLVRVAGIDDGAIARTLAELTGLDLIDPLPVDRLPAGEINPAFLADRLILPLAREGQGIVVAMADPTDAEAVDGLRFATGLAVLPKIGRVLALERALAPADDRLPPQLARAAERLVSRIPDAAIVMAVRRALVGGIEQGAEMVRFTAAGVRIGGAGEAFAPGDGARAIERLRKMAVDDKVRIVIGERTIWAPVRFDDEGATVMLGVTP